MNDLTKGHADHRPVYVFPKFIRFSVYTTSAHTKVRATVLGILQLVMTSAVALFNGRVHTAESARDKMKEPARSIMNDKDQRTD